MTHSVPLSEYWEQLSRHDWTHPYSDDHGVWERGSAELRRLREIATQSEEHRALFDAMEAHGWHRGPLPPLPDAAVSVFPPLSHSIVATIGLFALIMGSFFGWAFQ